MIKLAKIFKIICSVLCLMTFTFLFIITIMQNLYYTNPKYVKILKDVINYINTFYFNNNITQFFEFAFGILLLLNFSTKSKKTISILAIAFNFLLLINILFYKNIIYMVLLLLIIGFFIAYLCLLFNLNENINNKSNVKNIENKNILNNSNNINLNENENNLKETLEYLDYLTQKNLITKEQYEKKTNQILKI